MDSRLMEKPVVYVCSIQTPGSCGHFSTTPYAALMNGLGSHILLANTEYQAQL